MKCKQRKHKFMVFLCIAALGIGMVIPVQAYTVPFDVTLPDDPLSPRSSKDDNVQLFYVTGSTFNMSGVPLQCCSYGVYDPSITSDYVYIVNAP